MILSNGKNIFDLKFILLLGVYLFPNLRFFNKFILHNSILFEFFYLILIILFFIIISNYSSSKILKYVYENEIFLISFFVIIILLTIILYPQIDNLKLDMKGSDQDDCIKLGVKNLIKNFNPYHELTYFGNKCSSGLGIILLYFPFVLLKIYPLTSIFIMALYAYVLNKFYNNNYLIYNFIILNFSSLIFIELLFVGSDLITIGLLFCFISLLTEMYLRTKNKKFFCLLILATTITASSRINFIYLVPVITIFIFIHDKKYSILFFLITISLTILPSLYIYLINPESFSPLHLILKSENILTNYFKEIAIILSLLFFIYSVFLIKKNIKYTNIAYFLILFPSLFMLSLGDLINVRQLNFDKWEGANYLAPIISLISQILILKVFNINNIQKDG